MVRYKEDEKSWFCKENCLGLGLGLGLCLIKRTKKKKKRRNINKPGLDGEVESEECLSPETKLQILPFHFFLMKKAPS